MLTKCWLKYYESISFDNFHFRFESWSHISKTEKDIDTFGGIQISYRYCKMFPKAKHFAKKLSRKKLSLYMSSSPTAKFCATWIFLLHFFFILIHEHWWDLILHSGRNGNYVFRVIKHHRLNLSLCDSHFSSAQFPYPSREFPPSQNLSLESLNVHQGSTQERKTSNSKMGLGGLTLTTPLWKKWQYDDV